MLACSSTSNYVKPNQRLIFLLEQCLSITHVKQIQSHLTVSGIISDPYIAGNIIDSCAKSHQNHLSYAYKLFLNLPKRTVYTWNAILKLFAAKKEPTIAVALYKKLLRSGFSPNNYTFSFLLRASADLSNLQLALSSHTQVMKFGWDSYDFVQNGLIHMYSTCGCMSSARTLFDTSSCRDVITWTSLVNGYLKSGQIMVARELFDEMPERNVVSWSAMINGYTQVGLFKEALDLFTEMLERKVRPNHSALLGALAACALLGALEQGQWIHSYINRNKMGLDRGLNNALIDMYAKCGCIKTANLVFDEMPINTRNVFSFTSMISGLANHGESDKAINLFFRMQNEGVAPNEVTFICVLNACSRMGLVNQGLSILNSMEKIYGIEPRVEHYGCVVDLLGRTGYLEEAKKVVKNMPMEPDCYVLGALLNACSIHDDLELGNEIVEKIIKKRMDHAGVRVLHSNIYASAKKWDEVEMVRKEMDGKKVRKVAGCSMIEVDGIVWEFITGKRCYKCMDEMISILVGIDKHLQSCSFDVDRFRVY